MKESTAKNLIYILGFTAIAAMVYFGISGMEIEVVNKTIIEYPDEVPVPQERQILEDYRQRLKVCFDYSPLHGDYQWRHDFCQYAEKEYLELFNETYGQRNLELREAIKELLEE